MAGSSGSNRPMASLRERLEHRWASRRMSAYVDDELGLRERRRLERHAELCPECGPMRQTLLWLKRELRGLRQAPERSVAPAVIDRWIASERERAASGGGERDGW